MTATISIRPDGGIELHDWPGWAMRVLDEMALLAGPEFPESRVRDRFFQAPAADPQAAEEWRRNQHPDLFALFASSQDVVVQDLGAARRNSAGAVAKLVIPKAHVPGWIAAINAARLHLGAMHDVAAADMQAPIDDVKEDLRPVVARIDMLGELQFHMIRAVEPLAPESMGVFPADGPDPASGAPPGNPGETAGEAPPKAPRKRSRPAQPEGGPDAKAAKKPAKSRPGSGGTRPKPSGKRAGKRPDPSGEASGASPLDAAADPGPAPPRRRRRDPPPA